MSRFDAWLKSAMPGDRYAYHNGPCLISTPASVAARRAYDAGLVELVQKRTEKPGKVSGVGRFDYLAVMRAEPIEREIKLGAFGND